MDKYTKIKEKFCQRGSKTKALKMSEYMRDQFPFYGLATPQRREVYRDLLKEEKKSKKVDWLFLDQCYEDEHREFQYLVVDYLTAMQKFLTYKDVPKIKEYIKAKQWWDTIDGFDTIVGDIALVDDRINDLMLEWSKDDDFWIRRIAIDHQLCRKEKTDTKLLEQIIVNNFDSDEFFINKAIGWSLREYSKTNPEWVRDFLNRYRDQMNQLSIREASKYV